MSEKEKAKGSQNNKGIDKVQAEFDLAKGMKANGKKKNAFLPYRRRKWLALH